MTTSSPARSAIRRRSSARLTNKVGQVTAENPAALIASRSPCRGSPAGMPRYQRLARVRVCSAAGVETGTATSIRVASTSSARSEPTLSFVGDLVIDDAERACGVRAEGLEPRQRRGRRDVLLLGLAGFDRRTCVVQECRQIVAEVHQL